MKLAFVFAFLIPVSVIFWLFTLLFNVYKPDAHPISPIRFLIAFLAPVLIANWGLKRGSLDKSGAIAGLVVGFCLTISNLCFFSSLLMFFVSASKITKFRNTEKKKFEEDFKEGGQRNWIQVICNGGVAAWFSLLYLIDIGCAEKLIDFEGHYNASWYSLATLGCLCCSSGDTFSSEVGTVVGRSKQATLITTFKSVPRGTNGGISVAGTLASIVGGVLVGFAYYVTLLIVSSEDGLASTPPQWLLVPIGGLLGLTGSIIDSVLGATVQYSGYNTKTECIVNQPGANVKHISGTDILDNHSVNLIASFLTGLVAPRLAFTIWSYYTVT